MQAQARHRLAVLLCQSVRVLLIELQLRVAAKLSCSSE